MVYLFDFDGTLVDSMDAFSSTMLRILNESGVDYPDDVIKIITPLGYKGASKYFRELGVKFTDEELIGFMNKYAIEHYENTIEAKPDVVDTLKILKERGDSLNVLTASPHCMLDPCLKRIGIYDMFDKVWSCDDFDTTKSDPNIYKMAAKRLGVGVDEVTFLDDNFNADKTAKQAGMRVIGVYDSSSDEFVEDIKAVADGYIYNFKELL